MDGVCPAHIPFRCIRDAICDWIMQDLTDLYKSCCAVATARVPEKQLQIRPVRTRTVNASRGRLRPNSPCMKIAPSG